MSKAKSSILKAKLGKAAKTNRRVPVFVVAKTKRKVTANPLQRNWRRSKLGLQGEK